MGRLEGVFGKPKRVKIKTNTPDEIQQVSTPQMVAALEVKPPTFPVVPDSTAKAWLRSNNSLFQYHILIRTGIAEDLVHLARGNREFWTQLAKAPLTEHWAQKGLDNMDIKHGDEIPYHSHKWAEAKVIGMSAVERERFLNRLRFLEPDDLRSSFNRMRIQGIQELATIIRVVQADLPELSGLKPRSYTDVIAKSDLERIASFFQGTTDAAVAQQKFVMEIMAVPGKYMKTPSGLVKRKALEILIKASAKNAFSAEYNPHVLTEVVASLRTEIGVNIARVVGLHSPDEETAGKRSALIIETMWPRNSKR